VGNQRVQGVALLRHGAPQRAAGLPRRRRPGARLQERARDRTRSPVLGALVAAGSHRRLGRHVCARVAPRPGRDRRRDRHGTPRSHLRGRLPRGRGLRRRRPLERERKTGGSRVSDEPRRGAAAFRIDLTFTSKRVCETSRKEGAVKGVIRKAATVVLAVVVTGVAVAVTTGATTKKSASVEVCVLLPDTKSSVRWVQFDAPDFAKALKAAGVTYSITNALNDPQKMVSQADACLAAGAKIAVVTDIAAGTSIAIEKKFAKAGGKSIDYDRQVVGGIASVYVTFDGKAVGASQAKSVVGALKGKSKPVVAELWGGPTDQNAFWFKSGNDAVLNPLFASGKLTKGPQQFVPDWLATNAAPIFT